VINPVHRTSVFAWYNLFGYIASAIGALACGGLINVLSGPSQDFTRAEAYRATMIVYSVISVLPVILFLSVSPHVEAKQAKLKTGPVGSFLGLHKSKSIVMGLSLLFMVDSFGGGFVLQSYISNCEYCLYSYRHSFPCQHSIYPETTQLHPS